jgi:serine/threonine protein kinase
VFLGRHVALDRLVAVKRFEVLSAGVDPSFPQRFLREARTAEPLSHPNIVALFDFFEYDGIPYIAMEYAERGSLRPLIGALSFAQIGCVLEGVLTGLAHATRHGVLHRDLKPENLLISREGRIKIADFGIAKAIGVALLGPSLKAPEATVGAAQYMSPEQVTDQAIGPQSDLYSLGIIAYELLAGHTPFADTHPPRRVLMRHVNDPIPDPRDTQPELDAQFVEWTLWLLAKDPAKRPKSPERAWKELQPIVTRLASGRSRRNAGVLKRDAVAARERRR